MTYELMIFTNSWFADNDLAKLPRMENGGDAMVLRVETPCLRYFVAPSLLAVPIMELIHTHV